MILEVARQGIAAFHRCLRIANRFRNDPVARGLRNDVEGLEDQHTGTNESGQRPAEPGERCLAHQRSEDRHLELDGVPTLAAVFGVDPLPEGEHGGDLDSEDRPPERTDDLRDVDEQPRRQRQRAAELFVEPLEHRDDEQQHRGHDDQDENGNDRGIRHRRLDLAAELDLLLDRVGETHEHAVEHTADLAGAHHRHVETVERLGVLRERLRQ